MLQEYIPELIHIWGCENIAAKVFCRLDIVDTPNPVKNNIKSVNCHYEIEGKNISYPIND